MKSAHQPNPRQELRLFRDSTNESAPLIEAYWPPGADVTFATQGGGLLQRMPLAAFEKRFVPAQMPGYKLMAVSAEWLPDDARVPAYTNGRRWNGWGMPHFTLEVAQGLVEFMPDLKYDKDRDAFTWRAEPDMEEEVFQAEAILVDGEAVKVYPVGAGSWCWTLEEGFWASVPEPADGGKPLMVERDR